MAELKKLPKQFLQPSAPSLAGAAQAYDTLGQVNESVGKLATEFVKANYVLEEKTLSNKAVTDVQRLKAKYAADPALNAEMVQRYQDEALAITSGYVGAAAPAYAKSLHSSLTQEVEKNITSLMGDAYKNAIKQNKIQVSETFADKQSKYVFNIQQGNKEEALTLKQDIDEMLEAYKVQGGSAKEIQSMRDSVDTLGLAAVYKEMLKRSPTEQSRTAVMKDMMSLPDTKINNAAISQVWTEYNRLNKLYAKATDLTKPLENSATGKQHRNRSLSKKDANELVDVISKSIVYQVDNGQDPETLQNYEALPNEIEDTVYEPVQLAAEEEAAFLKWYEQWAKKTGISEDPDDPMHFYDYRAAYINGAKPEIDKSDGKYHWPSEYKHDDHPNRFVDGIDTKKTSSPKVTNAIAKSIEDGLAPAREPSLFELAQAHVFAGTPNSTLFTDKVSDIVMAGPGEEMSKAVSAINYVYDKDVNVLNLDEKEDMIYSEFKLMRDAGRTDYDQMAIEARNAITKKSQADLKLLTDQYNSSFSTVGKGANELNKLFKKAIGFDAIKTESFDSFNDFNRILRQKYILSNGNIKTAVDAATREMARIHGADKFSEYKGDLTSSFLKPLGTATRDVIPGVEFMQGLSSSNYQYTRYAPTKVLAGLTPTQIQNQFLEQIVMAAERNPNIILPEHFNKIKDATDAQKMKENLSYPPPDWSAELGDLNSAIYIKQKVDGINEVEGRLFFRANSATVQNESGQVAWEVWMQDRSGRVFPVIDNDSPYQNRLVVIGQSLQEFVPEYAANQSEEDIQKAINEKLAKEGRELYPLFTQKGTSLSDPTTWSPVPFLSSAMSATQNYKARKAYREDLKNKEEAERKIKAIMGRKEEVESLESKAEPVPAKNESVAVKAIDNASNKTGVDKDTLMTIAQIESSLRPDAKAKSSSASGLFQLTNATWNETVDKYGQKYGVTKDQRMDAEANALMGALHIRDLKKGLEKELGREPDVFEIYLAHFAGLSGAKRAIAEYDKNPNAKASVGFSKKAIESNKGLLKGTLKDVFERIRFKVESATR